MRHDAERDDVALERRAAGLDNVGMTGQLALDLLQLDTVAADLYLQIGAAEEFEFALLIPSNKIAGAVRAAAAGERIGRKCSRVAA